MTEPQRSETPPRLRVGGVPEHFNLPWQRALAKQDALPTPVSWTDYPGGTGAMCRALDAGDLDVAVLLTEGIVKHVAAGSGARIIAEYTESPLVWGVHTGAASAIRSVDDLRGGTYAISRYGSGSHLMAQLDAAERGWPEPEFEVVGDLAGGRRALAAGSSDAFMWEKTTSLPLVHDGEWRRVGEYCAPWPAFVVAVAGHVRIEQLLAVKPLLARVRAECEAVMADRDAAAPAFADAHGIPVEDVRIWLGETRWSCVPQVGADMLDQVQRALVGAGILEHAVDPTALALELP